MMRNVDIYHELRTFFFYDMGQYVGDCMLSSTSRYHGIQSSKWCRCKPNGRFALLLVEYILLIFQLTFTARITRNEID